MGNLPLAVDEADLRRFCKRHGIRELSFFGSILREDFTDTSDVDVLVEFDPPKSLWERLEVQYALEDLLGRKVDLITVGALKGPIGDSIRATRIVEYVRT